MCPGATVCACVETFPPGLATWPDAGTTFRSANGGDLQAMIKNSSTCIRAGNLCRNPGGGFFFFESYINLTAFLSSQNSCLPLHFWGSTLDAPDETFEASSFYFIGWLIEWQTSKTRVETVDFQHLHMNWWVLFISNSHVMPTDLWWTCDVSHQELNGKSGVCRLEPQRLDVYT